MAAAFPQVALQAKEAADYILLGDFNVVSPDHETMQALKSEGFTVPDAIDGRNVRDEDDHFYDQIAVRVKDPRFRVVTGGIVDMFAAVFRDGPEDMAIYRGLMPAADPEEGEPEALYRKWRTWQMSDHAPLWIEIETGIGGVRRFVSAAIADWRSWVSAPISLTGDASTNALIADGTTVCTVAVATGA